MANKLEAIQVLNAAAQGLPVAGRKVYWDNTVFQDVGSEGNIMACAYGVLGLHAGLDADDWRYGSFRKIVRAHYGLTDSEGKAMEYESDLRGFGAAAKVLARYTDEDEAAF